VVISGDKGFAGAFNRQHPSRPAFQFIGGNPDKEIDIEAVGRKARDLTRRRYPVAVYSEHTDRSDRRQSAHLQGARAQGSSRGCG